MAGLESVRRTKRGGGGGVYSSFLMGLDVRYAVRCFRCISLNVLPIGREMGEIQGKNLLSSLGEGRTCDSLRRLILHAGGI